MRYLSLLFSALAVLLLTSCDPTPPAQQQTSEPADTVKSTEKLLSVEKQAKPATDGRDVGKAYKLFQQGVGEMKEQKYEAAVSTFLLALESDPENPKIFYNLGSCYYSLKEYSLALSYFGDAVRFNPSDTSSMIYTGMIHYAQGRIEESIVSYTNAIEINDQLYMAWYNRGTSYGRLEKYDEAIHDFTAALVINPSHGNSYMNRGLAYFYKGETDLACKDWQKAASMGVTVANEAIREHCK